MSRWKPVATAISFAAIWAEVINHLQHEWSINPQYNYGWSVPFLALYLLWRRWEKRPVVAAPTSTSLIPLALIALFSVAILPVRFVAEANPDWRFLSWSFSIAAAAISLSSIYLAGGMTSLRWFAFPVLFFLVAVPWPMQLENAVVQTLMRVDTAINVTLLDAIRVPAVQQGNVIEMSTGLIGIEEACSGIRSLQATLMISLFLGEYHGFSLGRRLVLLLSGAIFAFFCNLVRTGLLVWVGAKDAAKGIEAWHDPAGMVILVACLFGLWFLSLAMDRKSIAQNEALPSANHSGQLRSLSWNVFAALGIWMLVLEGTVQAWYVSHNVANAGTTPRTLHWPTREPGYKPVAIPHEAQMMLRYNQGGGGMWKSEGGNLWNLYFFRWFPGQTAALFVRNHRPDVCLPAAGMTIIADSGIQLVEINHVTLPIRSYRFEQSGHPLHVMYCYWDGRPPDEAATEDWTVRGRLRAAAKGRRDRGAQMLEIAVSGNQSDSEVREALLHQLEAIIATS